MSSVGTQRLRWQSLAGAMAAFALAGASLAPLAHALTIELKDVAPDRIERQRAAEEGALPLPGTPDLSSFKERLAEKGGKLGSPVFIRVFKAESELEVWIRNDKGFVLFATYPVCHWSGTIGPKVKEGDKQTPEGFYSVQRRQLHRSGRWPQALNLGFPNVYDRALERTGSYLLVHGGCSSVGCFAMTNTVIEEIFELTFSAIRAGQAEVPVHVFPFRMSDANLALHQDSEWIDFWRSLKEGYDSFERTRVPPKVLVCEKRYLIADGGDGPEIRHGNGRRNVRGDQACPPAETITNARLETETPDDGADAEAQSRARAERKARVAPRPSRAAAGASARTEAESLPGANLKTLFTEAH